MFVVVYARSGDGLNLSYCGNFGYFFKFVSNSLVAVCRTSGKRTAIVLSGSKSRMRENFETLVCRVQPNI